MPAARAASAPVVLVFPAAAAAPMMRERRHAARAAGTRLGRRGCCRCAAVRRVGARVRRAVLIADVRAVRRRARSTATTAERRRAGAGASCCRRARGRAAAALVPVPVHVVRRVAPRAELGEDELRGDTRVRACRAAVRVAVPSAAVMRVRAAVRRRAVVLRQVRHRVADPAEEPPASSSCATAAAALPVRKARRALRPEAIGARGGARCSARTCACWCSEAGRRRRARARRRVVVACTCCCASFRRRGAGERDGVVARVEERLARLLDRDGDDRAVGGAAALWLLLLMMMRGTTFTTSAGAGVGTVDERSGFRRVGERRLPARDRVGVQRRTGTARVAVVRPGALARGGGA